MCAARISGLLKTVSCRLDPCCARLDDIDQQSLDPTLGPPGRKAEWNEQKTAKSQVPSD